MFQSFLRHVPNKYHVERCLIDPNCQSQSVSHFWMYEKTLSNDFKNVMRKKYENVLCDMDKPRIEKLKDFNSHL